MYLKETGNIIKGLSSENTGMINVDIKKEEKIPVSVRDGKIFLSRFYSKTDVLEGRKEKITDKRQIVIKAKHLEYWYDKKMPLLRDVNLEIEQQQCYAILEGEEPNKDEYDESFEEIRCF